MNAANSSLLGGGGVDAAIHLAGDLPANHVVHTVGPVFTGDNPDEHDALLTRCYHESLRLGAKRNASSITFPSISTGVYQFPKDRACRVATQAVHSWLDTADHSYAEVTFVCFDQADLDIYVDTVKQGGLQ